MTKKKNKKFGKYELLIEIIKIGIILFLPAVFN